jgi:hypothetical protein
VILRRISIAAVIKEDGLCQLHGLNSLPTCSGSSFCPMTPIQHPDCVKFKEREENKGDVGVVCHICQGGGWRGQMSVKNCVSASQVASFCAPFTEPSRCGRTWDRGPRGRRALLLAIWQNRKWNWAFRAPQRQSR